MVRARFLTRGPGVFAINTPLPGAAVRRALGSAPALDSLPGPGQGLANRPDRLAAQRFEQAQAQAQVQTQGQAQAQALAVTATPLSLARRASREFWRRLSLTYALGTVGVQAEQATTRLTFAPGGGGGFVAEGQTQTVAGTRFPLLTSFGYQLDLWPRRLYVRYAGLGVFGQYGQGDLGSRTVGLGFDLNLRPRHRPLLLRLGFDYVNLNLGRETGTFQNPDRDLRLDGQRLKGDALAVAVQVRTRTWAPRLGLGLELDHRTQLFVDATYLLDPRTTAGLSLREVSGFFLSRSEAATSLAKAGSAATLQVRDAPAQFQPQSLPWQPQRLLQIGLVQRLR